MSVRKRSLETVQELLQEFQDTPNLSIFVILYNWLIQDAAKESAELAIQVERELRANLDLAELLYQATCDVNLHWWIYRNKLLTDFDTDSILQTPEEAQSL